MAATVTILGGGFAGLAAAGELAGCGDVCVRLIDRRADSVFSPLLPDVVSGRLRARRLAFPLADYCRRLGVEFVRANVRSVDPSDGRVRTDAGEFQADFLLNTLGCETNYFGFDDARRRAVGLKSLTEAAAIRRRTVDLLTSTRGDRPANLIVVGGGYTGFETASHLAYLASGLTGLEFRELDQAAKVTVVEKADEVLRNVSPQTRRWSVHLLRSLGVGVCTNTTIESFDGDSVRLTDGRTPANALVVWSAGVAPGEASAALEASNGGRRLEVDEHLRVAGCQRMFAAGDVAAATRPGESTPLRMGVQFSISGGRLSARNILRAIGGRELLTFNPLDPGYLVPLAPGRAAGVVLGREFRGRFPYLLHYFMGMARSWGRRNRFGLLGDMLLDLQKPEV